MDNGIPIQNIEQMKENICNPKGAISFRYTNKDMFNSNVPGGVIFEIVSGEHIFRVERDENLLVNFYHSSPGTGTRVATIDLKQMIPADTMFFSFIWTPEQIKFYAGPQIEGGKLLSAIGIPSKKQYRVGKDNLVYQLGDKGLEVMGVHMYQNGKLVLESTAIDSWNETLRGIKILSTGESKDGYLYECVLANMILSILVTGFETYSKKRFQEIEKEGIPTNISNVIKAFFPKKEQDSGIEGLLFSEAADLKISPLQLIINRDIINFQNFDSCKKAYNKAYDIKFGEIGIDGQDISYLRRLFDFRHRVIHVSPILGMLNGPEVPPEEPFFSNRKTMEIAINHFDRFIRKLHETSLSLKRDS